MTVEIKMLCLHAAGTYLLSERAVCDNDIIPRSVESAAVIGERCGAAAANNSCCGPQARPLEWDRGSRHEGHGRFGLGRSWQRRVVRFVLWSGEIALTWGLKMVVSTLLPPISPYRTTLDGPLAFISPACPPDCLRQ